MPTRDRKVRMRVISRMDAPSPDLERWFRSEVPTCWEMLLPNEVELLGVRWRTFEREHPGSKPPAGYEWLCDPADPRHATAEQIREARRMLARDK